MISTPLRSVHPCTCAAALSTDNDPQISEKAADIEAHVISDILGNDVCPVDEEPDSSSDSRALPPLFIRNNRLRI